MVGSKERVDLWIRASSIVWAGMVEKKVVCIWGLRAPTFLSENAYLWLLTTDELAEYKFLFVRHSQLAIGKMLEEYPFIYGHYKAGDMQSRKWLEWLGAKFGEAEAGIYPFVIRRKHG